MNSPSYKLLSKKGQGGMAEVFKAVKSGPDGFTKTVALKKILPTHSDQIHFIRMLSTEAKIHSYLNHPNIIQILDFFEEEGHYSIVLEYVDGKNLKELLTLGKERGAQLPWQASIFIMLEILKGLHYAHTKEGPDGPLHIVHRDVSPHNVLISYDGDVKLSDFGIARAQIERDETASGVLKGKYRYLSPEQVLNEKVTPASDIFSAGVTLYEILSGQHPFGEQQEYQTLQKIVDKPHVPLIKLLPNLNPEISHVIDQALQKNPQDRFKNARDFYEDLLELQDPSWITHGAELLSTLLGNIVPNDLRIDEKIEKTSVLPTFAQHSFFKKNSPRSIQIKFIWLVGIIIVPLFLGFFISKHKPASKVVQEKLLQVTDLKSSNAIDPQATIKKSQVKAIKNFGKMKLNGPADTYVYINGKNIGKLPLPEQNLPTGQYTILMDRGTLGRQIMTATVIQKEITQIHWK